MCLLYSHVPSQSIFSNTLDLHLELQEVFTQKGTINNSTEKCCVIQFNLVWVQFLSYLCQCQLGPLLESENKTHFVSLCGCGLPTLQNPNIGLSYNNRGVVGESLVASFKALQETSLLLFLWKRDAFTRCGFWPLLQNKRWWECVNQGYYWELKRKQTKTIDFKAFSWTEIKSFTILLFLIFRKLEWNKTTNGCENIKKTCLA